MRTLRLERFGNLLGEEENPPFEALEEDLIA